EPRPLGGAPVRRRRADRFDPEEMLRPLAAAATTGGGPSAVPPGSGAPATGSGSSVAATAAAVRCWVDLSGARRALLYFSGRAGDRFLIRDVELSGRFDELDRQSLAQVLELSIAA